VAAPAPKTDDDGRRDLDRAEHVVDTGSLILPRVADWTIGESKRRKIEGDDVKAGRGQRVAGAPPQFAPRRRAVKQHNRNAVGRTLFLNEDSAGVRRHQMAGPWRQFSARAGFAYRRSEAKRDDQEDHQQQQHKQALGRPSQDV
jgi:hypothetical protein